MSGFDIDQLLGLSAAKIFGALFVSMLIKSPGNIDGDTGIKRIIGTKNNVNLPIHAFYTTVPKTEPTAAVSPIANAPQKATRKAPLMTPDPPV